jgi:hypothetical protein
MANWKVLAKFIQIWNVNQGKLTHTLDHATELLLIKKDGQFPFSKLYKLEE